MFDSARGYISVLGTAFILAACATQAAPLNLAGDYAVPRDSGIITNARPAGPADCPSPDQYVEGQDMCIEPTAVTDTLTLTPQDNGDLAFNIFTNAFNGHSCSAEGVARQTGAQSWRFERQSEYGEGICKVDITVKGGSVHFQQDYEAGSDCRDYCGNRASLGGTFPLSSQQP
ncbi:MAG: hypothetical protein IBX71_05185 [Candidatus Desulforudis sp.]|nr:hypothetical protein [Desulforudis sp.]